MANVTKNYPETLHIAITSEMKQQLADLAWQNRMSLREFVRGVLQQQIIAVSEATAKQRKSL